MTVTFTCKLASDETNQTMDYSDESPPNANSPPPKDKLEVGAIPKQAQSQANSV